MPLTTQESIGLGVNVLNIWHKNVNADSMRQLDLVMRQYVDDRIVAYVLKEQNEELGVRVVKVDAFKRKKYIITE
tara:strand:+ start:779 stop:1003 length:225 start_codon:yes stop_codon:yes gene_type:complete